MGWHVVWESHQHGSFGVGVDVYTSSLPHVVSSGTQVPEVHFDAIPFKENRQRKLDALWGHDVNSLKYFCCCFKGVLRVF